MADKINSTVEALISGLEGYATTKTVLGQPIKVDGMTIIPMADVSMGVAAGSFNRENKATGTGGAGVKVSPSALLIIQNGTSKIVNIKDKDSVNKLIDMIPDIVNKISGLINKDSDAAEEDVQQTEADND